MAGVVFLDFFPFVGGAEVVTLRLARALVERGWEVTFCAREALLEAAHGLKTCSLPFLGIPRVPPLNYASHFVNMRRTRRVLLEVLREKPLAIHAAGGISAAYALSTARESGVPLIWHLHDVLPPTPRMRMIAHQLRQPDVRVVAVSDAALRAGLEVGVPADRIRRIYNGIDLRQWTRRPHGTMRTALATPDDAPVFAMVDIVAASKGVEVFVGAAHRLAHAEAEFWIVDESYTADSAYLDHVRQLAAGGPAADRIFLIPRQADVSGLLSEVDVLVQPSIAPDSLPSTIMEAMAISLPVIGTTVGGIPEMIVDRRSGLLIAPDDVSALVGAMGQMLASAEVRVAMGSAGRERCRELFDLDTWVSSFVSLYQEAPVPA